jgi:hypothetical protein
MRIAHLTTDELNQALAVRFGRSLGVELICLDPEELPANARYDAVLCDLDRVPPNRRQALLDEIHSESTASPMAIYGYCLSEDQARKLRFHGVAVAQSLNAALVRTLVKAVRQHLTVVPPDDALTELTWINVNS